MEESIFCHLSSLLEKDELFPPLLHPAVDRCGSFVGSAAAGDGTALLEETARYKYNS